MKIDRARTSATRFSKRSPLGAMWVAIASITAFPVIFNNSATAEEKFATRLQLRSIEQAKHGHVVENFHRAIFNLCSAEWKLEHLSPRYSLSWNQYDYSYGMESIRTFDSIDSSSTLFSSSNNCSAESPCDAVLVVDNQASKQPRGKVNIKDIRSCARFSARQYLLHKCAISNNPDHVTILKKDDQKLTVTHRMFIARVGGSIESIEERFVRSANCRIQGTGKAHENWLQTSRSCMRTVISQAQRWVSVDVLNSCE